MAGLLEGEIAKAIYAGFKGKLLKGTLIRYAPTDLTLDLFGDPVNINGTNYPCEGFVEDFSEFFRRANGIPDTDVKVLIFAQSITTKPTNDDVIIFRGISYQVRKMTEIDPAIATYCMQCFEIKHGNSLAG